MNGNIWAHLFVCAVLGFFAVLSYQDGSMPLMTLNLVALFLNAVAAARYYHS